MSRLLVKPEAEFDLLETALRYEGERDGLDERFLDAVKATFERIEHRPMQFPAVTESVRRALVPRFPYGVFFTLDDGVPAVIAVIHLHREPVAWRQRM